MDFITSMLNIAVAVAECVMAFGLLACAAGIWALVGVVVYRMLNDKGR